MARSGEAAQTPPRLDKGGEQHFSAEGGVGGRSGPRRGHHRHPWIGGGPPPQTPRAPPNARPHPPAVGPPPPGGAPPRPGAPGATAPPLHDNHNKNPPRETVVG